MIVVMERSEQRWKVESLGLTDRVEKVKGKKITISFNDLSPKQETKTTMSSNYLSPKEHTPKMALGGRRKTLQILFNTIIAHWVLSNFSKCFL